MLASCTCGLACLKNFLNVSTCSPAWPNNFSIYGSAFSSFSSKFACATLNKLRFGNVDNSSVTRSPSSSGNAFKRFKQGRIVVGLLKTANASRAIRFKTGLASSSSCSSARSIWESWPSMSCTRCPIYTPTDCLTRSLGCCVIFIRCGNARL